MGLATKSRIGRISLLGGVKSELESQKVYCPGGECELIGHRVEMKKITKPNYKLTGPSELRAFLRARRV